MHGKNFCGATRESSIKALSSAGSDWLLLPRQARSLSVHQQLALTTHALLDSLGIDKAIMVDHSTGVMLATRYALSYPQATERLVLVNPIGLQDWKAKACRGTTSTSGISAS